MRQATALALKLVAYLVIFGVTMPIFGVPGFSRILVLAAVHTLLLWLADLVIEPRFGNTVATVGDFLILVFGSFIVLGAMGALPSPLGFTLAVALGTLFEFWFHRWLREHAIID